MPRIVATSDGLSAHLSAIRRRQLEINIRAEHLFGRKRPRNCAPERYWQVRKWSGRALADSSFAKDPALRHFLRYAGGRETGRGRGYTEMEGGVFERSAVVYLWCRNDRVLYIGSTVGPLSNRFNIHDVIKRVDVCASDKFIFHDYGCRSARKLERDLIDRFVPYFNQRRGCYCPWFPEQWVPRTRGRVLHSDPGTILDLL
jgi:hypothetical protein